MKEGTRATGDGVGSGARDEAPKRPAARPRPPKRAPARPNEASARQARPRTEAVLPPSGEAAGRREPGTPLDAFEAGVARLQREAARLASGDAESDVPRLNVEGRSESERELAERCRAFFRQWQTGQRKKLNQAVAAEERRIAESLGDTGLAVDRLERTIDDLRRLKGRRDARRRTAAETGRFQRLPTRWYVAALAFLAGVELFANAPVFTALLPRDPATERQLLRVTEGAEGWMAGTQRVLAELVLRPDAALLAAGVVTFLLLLAHFFGHSLRSAVARRLTGDGSRAAVDEGRREDLVPLVLAGLGLVLVVGVLYQARVTLGEVGESRWERDTAVVETLRREAAGLRAEGDLVGANERVGRAEDMEAEAEALREYATSMSRLSLPILLLNVTLVLCAISAAYFHQQVVPRPPAETSFERERRVLLEASDAAAVRVTDGLAALADHLRRLRDLLYERSLTESRALVHELEAVITLYRSENGRARGLDPRNVPAFREPVALEIDPAAEGADPPMRHRRSPDEYDRERLRLKERSAEARTRLAAVAGEW